MRKLKQNRTFVIALLILWVSLCFLSYGRGANEESSDGYSLYPFSLIKDIFISSAYAQVPPSGNAERKGGTSRERSPDPGKIRTTPSRLHLLAPPGQPVTPPMSSEPLATPPGDEPGTFPSGSGMTPEKGSGGPVHVQVNEGKVQILAENISFGDVMNEMAKEMGFRLKIPSDLSGKKVSISLYDVPVDRALIRLFSLVQEKNYKVKYSEVGSVTHVEVIDVKGTDEGPSAAPEAGERGSPATMRQPRRRYQPYRPPAVRPRSLPSRPPARNALPPGPEYMRPPE